ncbi:RNA polymerase sigma factor [Kribbella sp. CA-253562]|uniref:RNA polymerase sigma factor n=1 Tax=Kribbella sp. CA-253562 TaxID=3239942 RepID=UPI003D9146F1
MTGWERSFDDLLSARGPALSRYAYLLCGDASNAADLVQEALLRVFARLQTGDDIDQLEAYTRRAVLNLYLEGRRKQDKWEARRHLLTSRSETDLIEEQIPLRTRVLDAVASLSPRQRACVILRYYDDLTVPAIAAELGCSVGTVKRHLADAKVRLADELGAIEEAL